MCRVTPFVSRLEIEQSGVRLVPSRDKLGRQFMSVYLDNGSGGRSLIKRYRNPATAVSVANLLAGAKRVKDRNGGKPNAHADRRGKSGR